MHMLPAVLYPCTAPQCPFPQTLLLLTLNTSYDTVTHLNMAMPGGLPGHMHVPPDWGRNPLVFYTEVSNIACHSYCQTRNRHRDYLITHNK